MFIQQSFRESTRVSTHKRYKSIVLIYIFGPLVLKSTRQLNFTENVISKQIDIYRHKCNYL